MDLYTAEYRAEGAGFDVAAFGERISSIRRYKRLKLTDLAAACGLSASAWSAIERGQRLPGIEKLPLLSRFLGVSVEWLVLGGEPPALPWQPPHRKDTEKPFSL